jgi:mRNA-degrading endonuclease toxin of MazEF toxin-antitoxin module
VTRGEIWLVNLDPTIGSEIRKTRPCVVVSPSEMHDHLRTVSAARVSARRPSTKWPRGHFRFEGYSAAFRRVP